MLTQMAIVLIIITAELLLAIFGAYCHGIRSRDTVSLRARAVVTSCNMSDCFCMSYLHHFVAKQDLEYRLSFCLYSHYMLSLMQVVFNLSCAHVGNLQTWSVQSATVEATAVSNASRRTGADTPFPAKSSQERNVKSTRKRKRRNGKKRRQFHIHTPQA